MGTLTFFCSFSFSILEAAKFGTHLIYETTTKDVSCNDNGTNKYNSLRVFSWNKIIN
jgi:hypothetical protein